MYILFLSMMHIGELFGSKSMTFFTHPPTHTHTHTHKELRVFIHKRKTIPVRAYSGQEGPRRLKFPDLKTVDT